jgi:hypothetical protein
MIDVYETLMLMSYAVKNARPICSISHLTELLTYVVTPFGAFRMKTISDRTKLGLTVAGMLLLCDCPDDLVNPPADKRSPVFVPGQKAMTVV